MLKKVDINLKLYYRQVFLKIVLLVRGKALTARSVPTQIQIFTMSRNTPSTPPPIYTVTYEGYVANNEWVLDRLNQIIGSSPVVTTNNYNTPRLL
jgi:hypothetical protein